MRTNQLEGLAAEILSEHGVTAPVNAFRLTRLCGLQLRPVSAYEEGISGGELRFNGRAAARVQHEAVVRMLARCMLERYGFFPTDSSVAHVARALMLPLNTFIYDLQAAPKKAAFEWMLARHVYTSNTLIGARVGDVHALRTSSRPQRRLITA